MKNISIDIIVPAFNAEKSIEKCILSLMNQTYENLKVIAINDQSTDRTLEKLQALEARYPNKLKVLSQQQQGPSAARNLGLKNSKADFIGFVDADDYVSTDMYKEMLEQADEDVDLVICGRYDIDKNNNLTQRLPNKKHNNTNIENNEQLISLTTTFVWDKIFKRSVIEQNSLTFPTSINYAEDCVFLTKYKLHSKKCKIITNPHYFHNISNHNSITNICNKNWYDIIHSLQEINNYYKKNNLFKRYEEQLRYLAIGFYNRRVSALSTHSNKTMQLKFFSTMHRFLNKDFPGWKAVVKKYYRFYTNKLAISLYILIPNKIKPSFFTKSKALQDYIIHKKTYRVYQQLTPLKQNSYLFTSYSGSSISDSPLYIAKELSKNTNNKIYFTSKNINKDRLFCESNNLNFELVDTASLQFPKLLATCKYVTTNSRVPTFFNKRKNQIFINTWHGTPLKTLGAGMRSGVRDIGRNQNQFLMSDYFLHPNAFTKEKISEDFCMDELFSGQHVLQGYPRNDPFFYSEERKRIIKNKLNLNGKKIFVYMPTWRGETINSINTETYKQELTILLEILDNALPDDTVLIVKLHQSLNITSISNSYKNIIPYPELFDIYEILSVSDLLITDYSSIMFDYLYSEKPIILFIYDYKQYNEERGFYIDAKETPFSKAYTTEELISLLKSPLSTDGYSEYIKRFCLPYKDSFTMQSINNIYKNKKQKAKSKKYDIYFCDPCNDKEDELKLLGIAQLKNRILVFHHSDINSKTEQFISDNKNTLQPFIVVSGEKTTTPYEDLLIKINNKTNLLNKAVRRIYQSESKRIFPNIKINALHNNSSRKEFQELVENLQVKG